MRWLSPPNRREIALILFCATVFTFAYNLQHSLRYIGLEALVTRHVEFSPSGLNHIEKDGRKSPRYRDQLDDLIIGNYEWKDGEVLNANLDPGQALGVGRHSAMWVGKQEQDRLWPSTGEPGVSAGFWRWNTNVPRTKLVKHVPGYTILDQVIAFKGVVYIVTDNPDTFPDAESMTTDNWTGISSEDALTLLGRYGGVIHGVSWMCTEHVPQNTTLLSLWSIYSSLKIESGEDSLPPPARLILPRTSVFEDSDKINDEKKPNLARRLRSSTGFHPFLAKVVFPHMGIMYKEDWADFQEMEVPYVIQRLVIADYQVSGPNGLSELLLKAASSSRNWWEPIRQRLASFLQERGDELDRKAVTYVYRHGALSGQAHESLVQALAQMGNDRGVDLFLVEAADGDRKNNMQWGERMAAVVRSNVLISVQGPDVLNGLFLEPSPQTTIVEIFSPDTASREHESIAKALGIKYIAWSNNHQLSSKEISYMEQTQEQGYDVPVDTGTVVDAIWRTLQR
ncbi:hypothetical protein D9757_004506 [Collybiopsis confluens]|uniref:Uncharacterized protein n=1 Tax=Collybiopsis confluens TaxID=2823264 RepID=A0A8H5HWH8_9AGAR|nr:hypothetical protein D9757_004506 [Collybiopsis confluens]